MPGESYFANILEYDANAEAYRTIFHAMADAIFLADPETGIIVECNRAAEVMLERSRDDIIGQPQTMIHPPERAEKYRTAFFEHVRELRDISHEHTCEVWTASGKILWSNIKASVIHLNGKAFMLGIFRDVTERQRLEEALEQSEERLSLATRGTGIGIWDYHVAEDRLDWDDRMFALFGVDRNRFEGRYADWARCLLPEALPKAEADFREGLWFGDDFHIEFPIRLPGGGIRHLAGAGTVIRNADGEAIRAVGVNYDITDRKEAEEAIRLAKDEWERTFHAVPDLITILDRDYRIVRVNRAMAEHLGETPDSCIGRCCYSHIHGSDAPPERCPFAMSFRDGEPHTMEIVEPRLGGVFRVTAVPLKNAAGEVEGCVHVAHDITELKRTQERLVDSERMAAVGLLVDGIAHQYNNAMTAVLGYLGMLSDDACLPADVRLIAEKGLAGGRKVTEITKNLLILTDRNLHEPVLFGLADSVEQALSGLRAALTDGHIDLHLTTLSNPGVLGTPHDIVRITENMVMNAMHALIDRPEKKIDIRVYNDRESAIVRIADTGEGMAPEDVPDIFLPFFSRKGEKGCHGSGMEKVRGVGLGLSVCKSIVKRHRGRIEVESLLGKGSVFTVFLPLAPDAKLLSDE